MSDIALNLNGDALITGGSLSLVDGVDAVAQLLNQRLRFFLGEWFLGLDKGIPYFEKIFQKNPDPGVVDSLLKDTILGTPGILRLLTFDIVLDTATRVMTVAGSAVSSTGVINFNVENIGP